MSYLAVAAVAFAAGLYVGRWLGRDEGYHRAMWEMASLYRQRTTYGEMLKAAKAGRN